LRSLALKDPTERKMPHSTFYYPLHGGIQSMIDTIAAPLTIKRSEAIESIERNRKQWRVNGDLFDAVVSTIPLKALPGVMQLPQQIVNAINELKYNSLTTFLVAFPKTDISWLYIPSMQWKSHRVVYQSSFSPHTVPDGSGSGAVEIIGNKAEASDTLIKQAVPDELGAQCLIDTQFSEYAYVIHDKNHTRNTSLTRGYFNGSDNFYSIGRWGSWNYNNMDMCMHEAFDVVEKITQKTHFANME
jgi:protoporphyrinogen oxidase